LSRTCAVGLLKMAKRQLRMVRLNLSSIIQNALKVMVARKLSHITQKLIFLGANA
jgi:hypothetical protein